MSENTLPPAHDPNEATTPEKFLKQAKWMLQDIMVRYAHFPGPNTLVVNALSEQIKKLENNQNGIFTEWDLQMGIMIGLTFDDMFQLRNGGTINIDPKEVGHADMPITIFLGGIHEHMEKGAKKHPDTEFKVVDSHGDQKN